MINVEKLVYDSFLKGFEKKKLGNVGVELEFPLVNLKKESVDENVARGVFEHFLKRGFEVEIEEHGVVYFISNKDGDCLSFDNSYNNFEFAMNYGDDLLKMSERFYALLKEAQSYFLAHNHSLVGLGTNPFKKYTKKLHVDFSTYNMVDEYLHKYGDKTPFPDFPAYLSSAQTHLDVPLDMLPRAYSLFAKIDFVRGMIFSNSPDFGFEGLICCRDYLWEQSAFSLCPNITGKVDGEFKNTDDIVQYIASKGMFNRIRDGKYEIFSPVSMREYFAREDAKENDIDFYLSFKNVEITRRGTLEIRSDCQQPFGENFAPAAFNTGILNNMDDAEECLNAFLSENRIEKSNTVLREEVVKGEYIADEGELYILLSDMCTIASDGLKKRGKGEEKLLLPLFDRAARLSCPGRDALGYESEEELIADYSRI
jgi:gamma-glutamylcysteine synthetase